ncbi:MAG: hypothetical protein PHG85_03400 [Candidatus Altiarchaeota archaeon]|nr:hypothetical protein [Candidatus Altiarchaeota archaeon]
MAPDQVFAGMPLDDFKAAVSRLVSAMGYLAGPPESVLGGFVLRAEKEEPPGRSDTMFHVFVSDKSASLSDIKYALDSGKKKDKPKTVVLSTAGFSEGALTYCGKHGIGVINPQELENLMKKHRLLPESGRRKLFELAFDLGMTLAEAREHFERHRGKKMLGFGSEERVTEISGRYAPVGRFEISREEEVATGFAKMQKTVKSSNTFHVNLATGDLYYVSSGLGKKPSLASSDMLLQLLPLPVNSARMLASILKTGAATLEELNGRFELFYAENRADFMLLLEHGFIAQTPDRKGFLPNLTLPEFANIRYDLNRHSPVSKTVSSDYEVDELKLGSRDILGLLELLFAGRGEIKEVAYLPYYTCRYTDDRGRTRTAVLPAPKYNA